MFARPNPYPDHFVGKQQLPRLAFDRRGIVSNERAGVVAPPKIQVVVERGHGAT